MDEKGQMIKGLCNGPDDIESAKLAATWNALTMLSTVKMELGSLDRVKKLVKTFGMVNSAPRFQQHPEVINGYSEVMRDVFGAEAGIGARSAVGMMLPRGVATEIEAIFELHP